MTTIVNNPPSANNLDGTLNTLIGVIALVIFGYLIWVYGIPAIKNTSWSKPEINIPSQIDINVNQAK